MSIAAPPLIPRFGIPPEPIQRLTVDQYLELVRLGKLTDDDHCELIEGWMVPKMTKGPAHELTSEILRDLLEAGLPAGWVCRSQGPIVLPDSVPEPDLSVVRGPRTRYQGSHPLPHDVALLVEVSDTTLARDRSSKLQAYARAEIRQYWIINLIDRQIETYSTPLPLANPPAYGDTLVYHAGDAVPVMIEGTVAMHVYVNDVL